MIAHWGPRLGVEQSLAWREQLGSKSVIFIVRDWILVVSFALLNPFHEGALWRCPSEQS